MEFLLRQTQQLGTELDSLHGQPRHIVTIIDPNGEEIKLAPSSVSSSNRSSDSSVLDGDATWRLPEGGSILL